MIRGRDDAHGSRLASTRVARRTLGVITLITALLASALWIAGPGGLTLGATTLGPFALEVASALLVLELIALECLRPRARQRLGRELTRVVACVRAASPARRMGMLASLVLLVCALDSVLAAPSRSLAARTAAAASPASYLAHNPNNGHVPGLLEYVVTRPDPGAVVIDIDDVDARGHTAAYYAYPRLLTMEPALRRWTLAARQQHVPGDDPGFAAPGARPATGPTLRFAEQRGVPALFVTRAATRVGAATHDGTAER